MKYYAVTYTNANNETCTLIRPASKLTELVSYIMSNAGMDLISVTVTGITSQPLPGLQPSS
jgi:hypothetical protein